MNKVQVLSDHISFDIAMIAKKKATGRKSKSIAHESIPQFASDINTIVQPLKNATCVFLYMQPKDIKYPDAIKNLEVELLHRKLSITQLSDQYTTENIINLDSFEIHKPTFSITIVQDDIEDVTEYSDAPVMLVLYLTTVVPESYLKRLSYQSIKTTTTKQSSTTSTNPEEEVDQKTVTIRQPIAIGYIDLLQFFIKQRCKSSLEVFLYPLVHSPQSFTCKMTWDIYSLIPLLKKMQFTNVVFIAFTSIYNANEELSEKCQNLIASLYFRSRSPNVKNEHEKFHICDFSAFSKEIIIQQKLSYKWENLKINALHNLDSMGIHTDLKFNVYKIFYNVLGTENVDFYLDHIDLRTDYALVCNSLHRFILTNNMQEELHEVLAFAEYDILVEIYDKDDPKTILLEGLIDLSIFMYPQVNACSFAIELKAPIIKPKPDLKKANPSTASMGSDKAKEGKERYKMKSKETDKDKERAKEKEVETENDKDLDMDQDQDTENDKESLIYKPTFAIVKICLKKALTEPLEDLNHNLNYTEIKRELYKSCAVKRTTSDSEENLEKMCEENYRCFDDSINQLIESIDKQNAADFEKDGSEFCTAVANMSNRLLPLIACDFNRRIPTKTNIEFSNMLTTVYQELNQRIYNLIYAEDTSSISRVTYIDAQNTFITHLNLAKYLMELNNVEMADYILDKLKKNYSKNPLLNFYILIYNVEYHNYEDAKSYFDKSMQDKDLEGQLFTGIITVYLDFIIELNNPETADSAMENLLFNLTNFCENEHQHKAPGWILLYTLYKKFNYLPGMAYARWKSENPKTCNLVEISIIPISRWNIYCNYKIDFKTERLEGYWRIVLLFLRLGLFLFAEWIFDEISRECPEAEKYILDTTFQILNNNLDNTFQTKIFDFEENQLMVYLNLINGHVEYSIDPNNPIAMDYYNSIIPLINIENIAEHQLGLLRLALHHLKNDDYENALTVFKLFSCDKDSNRNYCLPIIAYGRGKCCYYLNKLDEAEDSFASATYFGIYLPDVWGFLALINLKKGDNYKALECWKYARLNFEMPIYEEILNELDKINPDDVFLFVDVPE